MEGGGVVAICQFGGQFTPTSDGSMTYAGGEAHAIDIHRNSVFEDFKSEITSLFDIDVNTLAIKYFLPNNNRTLITVSCDKDLRRLVDFYINSVSVDVYILNKVDTRAALTNPGIQHVAAAQENKPKPAKRKRNAATITCERLPRTEVHLGNSVASVYAANNDGVQGEITAENDERRENCMATTDSSHLECASMILAGDDPRHLSLTTFADDTIAYVGQEFDNVKDFRDRLCEYAITKGFTYRFVKNECARVTAKCSAENCPWRVHASQTPRKKKFIIKKLVDVHTCGGGTYTEGQLRVTKKWLVNIIKEKLRDNPDCKPRDIADDISRDYGVNVSYFQVWHGKNDAEKELYKSHVEACNLLPWFCQKILESNPGSVVTLATSSDLRYRMFVSFHASLKGFEHGCRPLIFLDKIPLKRNNHLKLLAAAAIDGDDAIYPVAFAAVETESYDSWFWFLQQLKYAVATSRTITFVSSRRNGLEEAVPQVFEESSHSYNVSHLMQDFVVELNKGPWSREVKDAMVKDLEGAAEAYLVEDFNAYLENIRSVSRDAAEWIMATKPEHWSNAHFKGSRYNYFSADLVEFSDWISVRKESSVALIFDAICSKMIEIISARRESSSSWDGSLITPSMDQKLKKEMVKANRYDVLCSSESVFEVRGCTINVVNTSIKHCTCRQWEVTGLPCAHAIAVFDHLGSSVYDYCSPYFKIDCYRAAYLESVNKIPDVQRITSTFGIHLYPSREGKGPRRKLNKGDARPLHCSKCKKPGHNKATCHAADAVV